MNFSLDTALVLIAVGLAVVLVALVLLMWWSSRDPDDVVAACSEHRHTMDQLGAIIAEGDPESVEGVGEESARPGQYPDFDHAWRPPGPGVVDDAEADPAAYRFEANFPGQCGACGMPFPAGTPIEMVVQGVKRVRTHQSCPSSPAPQLEDSVA